MKRSHVILLAILAVGLTTGGTPPAQRAASDDRVHAEGADAVVRISEIVQRHNPTLSPDEGSRIAHAVARSAAKHRLDPDLVTAVLIVESGARPWARSPKGAVGLMQVMPYMVEDMRLAGNLTTVESNIEAGCLILADNIRRLGEDDGISAYFWGSNIRGVAYLDRVRAARAQLQRYSES